MHESMKKALEEENNRFVKGSIQEMKEKENTFQENLTLLSKGEINISLHISFIVHYSWFIILYSYVYRR
jgi:hypothetical protein